jgi:hypothetical protein
VQTCWVCGVEVDDEATSCLECSLADEALDLDDLLLEAPAELD